MKKILTLVLAFALIFAMAACRSAETPVAEPAAVTPAPTDNKQVSEVAPSPAEQPSAESGKRPVFAYAALTMSNQWLQNIYKAMTEIGQRDGFDVIYTDADYNAETQLSQIDQLITQGVDGISLFIVDEGMGPAAVQKARDANVPMVGETLRLMDDTGKLIAPCVELDGYNVGVNAANWVLENMSALELDPSDWSDVGFMEVTNTTFLNNTLRCGGFKDTFFKAYPDFPEANKFSSDAAAEVNRPEDTEGSYNQTTALISANPKIKKWLMFGSVDDNALGAIRAVEAAGLTDSTIMVSCGGERAIPEWQSANPSPAWKATCYYNACDFAENICAGLREMAGGATPENIFTDSKDSGETYGVRRISGRVVTPETYEEFYMPGY